MKIYKNQNKGTAFDLGFLSNFEFVNDKNIAPNGIDVIKFTNIDKKEFYEVSILNMDKTVNIMIMNEKEFYKWKEEKLDKEK